MAKHRFIAVAGTIGAGKTSLVAWLVKHYGLQPFYEPNEQNPYLEDFYQDMRRYAFHSQLFFLGHKLALHQELERCAVPAVIDRTIYEDAEIFARNLYEEGLMVERDYQVYKGLYQGIRALLRPPDVLLALRCSLRSTKGRIKRRGRPMEQGISGEYLRRLHDSYERWFASYDLSPVINIDTSRLDYVEDLLDLLELRRILRDVGLGE